MRRRQWVLMKQIFLLFVHAVDNDLSELFLIFLTIMKMSPTLRIKCDDLSLIPAFYFYFRVILCYNKIMFIRARSLSNAFQYFTAYVRMYIISELYRLVEKNQTV